MATRRIEVLRSALTQRWVVARVTTEPANGKRGRVAVLADVTDQISAIERAAAEQGERDREDAERWRALEKWSPEMAGAARRLIEAAPKLAAARSITSGSFPGGTL